MTDKTREPGTVHRVKAARQQWYCHECATLIQKGEPYMYLNTHDETAQNLASAWKRYILCPTCERIRSCFTVAELACGTEESYRSGLLRKDVAERRLIDNDFNHEYQIAWLASEPLDESSE